MAEINALIERCQAGDERATEVLYTYHRDQVFRLAYGILGDWEDAQEVAQDALIYALTKINRFNPQKARFSTWLHTITVCRCRNKFRSRRRFFGLSLTGWLERWADDVPESELDREAQIIRAELRDEVWQAIQALSRPLREAIILRHWAELTYREMAEVLGCPIRTAQSRVRLAHKSLRTTLAAQPKPASLGGLDKEQTR